MRKLSPREMVLLVCLFLLLSGYLFWHQYYLPLQQETAVITERNARMEKQLEPLRAWSGKEAELGRLRETIITRELTYMRRIPPQPDKAQILLTLDELARVNHLDFLEMEQREQDGVREDAWGSYVIEGKVMGEYHDLWSFLRSLESQTRLVAVERVMLKGTERKLIATEPPDQATSGESSNGAPVMAVPRTGRQQSSMHYDGSIFTCQFTLIAYFDQ